MKKWLITFGILGLLILNSPNFYDFYLNAKGNYHFANADLATSKSYYHRSNSLDARYNLANIDYKEKKYADALKKYLSLQNGKKEAFQADLLYNIGNTYYKLSLGNKQRQQEYLEKAVKAYTDSLDISYNDYTKKNLEFVLEKLKKLKEKKENKQENEQKNSGDSNQKENQDSQSGSGSSDSQTSKTGSGSQENSGSEKTGTGTENNEKNKSGTAGASTKSESGSQSGSGTMQEQKSAGESFEQKENSLSKEVQDQLKSYEESLKQDQKQNQQALGKVYDDGQNSNNPFDNFFSGDPFFDNGLLHKDDNKKDW